MYHQKRKRAVVSHTQQQYTSPTGAENVSLAPRSHFSKIYDDRLLQKNLVRTYTRNKMYKFWARRAHLFFSCVCVCVSEPYTLSHTLGVMYDSVHKLADINGRKFRACIEHKKKICSLQIIVVPIA